MGLTLLIFDYGLELSGKVVVFAMLIVSLGIHEAAHAWVALKCGDSTARDLGRLTLNPIAHIDPVMTILLPVVMIMTIGIPFGGAKPVPVVPQRLRNPTRDMMFVAIAGPASNFLQALVFMVAWKASVVSDTFYGKQLPNILELCVLFNVWLAVFNMLPLPPLDGSRVMAYFLPSGLREPYVGLERFGLLILVGFFVLAHRFPSIGNVVWVPLMQSVKAVRDFTFFLTGGAW